MYWRESRGDAPMRRFNNPLCVRRFTTSNAAPGVTSKCAAISRIDGGNPSRIENALNHASTSS